jgi:hypothetical protein
MFRASASRLRSWWDAVTDDILGGDLVDIEPELAYHLDHPHRRPLEPRRARRAGTVAPHPPLCISPVRAAGARERTTPLAR